MAVLATSQLPPEELRAGETIAYYSMAFTCSDPRGYRQGVVLKVDAGADRPVKVDNGDVLAPTQMVKRMANRRGRLIDAGKALWRKLRQFTLIAGGQEASTRASTFSLAGQGAVRQALVASHPVKDVPREEISFAVAKDSYTNCATPAVVPVSDMAASSGPTSRKTASCRRAADTGSLGRSATRAASPLREVGGAAGQELGGPGDSNVVQASSVGEVAVMPQASGGQATPRRGEGHAREGLASRRTLDLQTPTVLSCTLVVKLSDYVQSIPTWLTREKIRHQARKRPGSWHVPRSRKRRDQRKCGLTRSGVNIYHARTLKAARTKEMLQLPGVKAQLQALHVRQPAFGKSRLETSLVLSEVKWPASVKPIQECEVPEGISFPDIGDGDPCDCVGDCFKDSCRNAQLSIYCTPDRCALRGDCNNSPRIHPSLKLYDTCRVGLGVYTTSRIEVGDIVGEYTGRLCEYKAVVEGQPFLAMKQNSGYTMLLNTKSSSGTFVYIEALWCGSMTRFMSHSCKPNVAFVEMQNRSSVKVLAVMIRTVSAGTQLTVNYGDEIWFKCACDSCWVDPDDNEQ